MARPSTNASVRLTRLEAAIPKVAALKRGEVLSAGPMTKLLGVSWPTLREWCDALPGFAESKAFVAGGNGVEYQFRAKRTLDWLLKHFRGVMDRQAVESRRLTKAVGVNLPASETPSLAETKDLVNLTLTVVEASERQGHYVRADDVANFIEGYNETVISGIMGVRTKVDPNGKLPVALRRQVDEYLRSVAAGAHAKAQSYIEVNRGAGVQQGRTGRAGLAALRA